MEMGARENEQSLSELSSGSVGQEIKCWCGIGNRTDPALREMRVQNSALERYLNTWCVFVAAVFTAEGQGRAFLRSYKTFISF